MKIKIYIATLCLLLLVMSQINAQVPTITSFSPTQGHLGTIDTIYGTNFSNTPANNIVFYGALMAAVNSSTSTRITTRVPEGATYQFITVWRM